LQYKAPKVKFITCPKCNLHRTHVGSDSCRFCRWRKKRDVKAESARRRDQSKPCPTCGGSMAHTAKHCRRCATGTALTWEEVAAVYNYRNPDEAPISPTDAKNIGSLAIKKLREILGGSLENLL
jgi:hypothetical protein